MSLGKLELHSGLAVMKQLVTASGRASEDEAIAHTLLAVAPKQWKVDDEPDRRFISEALAAYMQQTVKLVCVPPAICERSMALRAVVMSVPPQLEWTCETELELPIEYGTGQRVDGVPDKPRSEERRQRVTGCQ
jgi:hypothetical protein